MFEKKKRIVNKKLLEEIKMQPCVICNKKPLSDPHHLKTVGSGGDDTKENVYPFCREHHTMIHKIGINTFIQTFPRFETKMRQNGWEIINGKWMLK